MNRGTIKRLWKRSLGLALSAAMAVAMLPAPAALAAESEREYPAKVPALPEGVKSIPEARRAGSIPASDATLTYEEPFAPFTAGNESFRIPTLISLRNNEALGEGEHLFASADARWEEWNDGGGIDSIASVSSDGGETWNYSFPIYFPDSYGYASRAATTVIDPGAIEGPDGTIYFIADVNPTGSTTMYGLVNAGSGYVTVNGKRYLPLTDDYGKVGTTPSDDSLTDYPYYVEEFDEDGYARILKRSDSSPTGYGVDEWYNIYTIVNGEYVDNLSQPQVNRADVEVQQNCFYKDSKFHVYHIDYIWVVKSTDGGRTWEHPRDITDQIKKPTENAILVSPGKGIVTSDGKIAIGLYTAQGSYGEHASMIYTEDGETWKRTADISEGSSEDEIVELADGTLRMFYRGGGGAIRYVDFTKNEQGTYDVGTYVDTGVPVKQSINVSAVLYSEEIDGKQAVIVARSGGGGGLTSDNRTHGKIFTFLVDDTQPGNPMTLKSTFNVPHGEQGFVYSCMTELKDGRIAILWEPNHSTLYYDIFTLDELLGNSAIEVEVEKGGKPYEMLYAEEPQISSDWDGSVVQIETKAKEGVFLRDHVANIASDLSSFSSKVNQEIDIAEAEFTFQPTGKENVYKIYNAFAGLYIENMNAGNMFKDTECEMTLTPGTESDAEKTFKIKTSNGRPVFFYAPNMDFNAQGSDPGDSAKLVLLEKQETVSDTDVIPGYARVSSVEDNGKYLITSIWSDGSVFALYPVNGGTDAHTKLAAVNPKAVVVTGVGEGQTVAEIAGEKYQFAVKDLTETLELENGETYFIPAQERDAAPDVEGGAVTVQKVEEFENGLFDHVEDKAFSLDSFSDTANSQINLADAEFTFEASGSNWRVSHDGLYLSNPERASAFFSTTPENNDIKATAGENNTFRLSRATALKNTSNGNINTDKTGQPIGNLVFYYREMNFRSYGTETKAGQVHGANPYGQHASYNLTLLEKQDRVSADDALAGYKAVSSITSGKKYLISYIWEDGSVMVLYPENGIANSTKLASRAKKGFLVTAKEHGEASFAVDGTTYRVSVVLNQEEKDQAAADVAIEAINAIGDVTLGEASQKKIEEAREAYDALTEDQKKLVQEETLKILTDAEERYDNLIKEEEKRKAEEEKKKKDQAAAKAAQDLIGAIGTVSNTAACQQKINAAKAAYEKLTTEQKKLIPASVLQILTNAQTKLANLKQEEQNKKKEEEIKSFTFGNYKYAVTGENTVEVTGAVKKKSSIVIPSDVTYNNRKYTVTGIAANAFKNDRKATKLTIGKNVETIGDGAFSGCRKIDKAAVNSAQLAKIGKKAFYNCKALKSIIIKSKKLKSVGGNAFKGISKKAKIKVPSSKWKAYGKTLKNRGQSKSVKIIK